LYNIIKLGDYKNLGILACYKGINPENYTHNTGAIPEGYEKQFKARKLLEDLELVTYDNTINPHPVSDIPRFLDDMKARFGPDAAKNVHNYEVKVYKPTEDNMAASEAKGAPFTIYPKEEIEQAFDDYLRENDGVGYKEVLRPTLHF
jgi:hypothetical protein